MDQQSHENREMSRTLYEELAALRIRIAFAEIDEDELAEFDRDLSSVSEGDYSEAAQKRTLKLIERKLNRRLQRRFIRNTLPRTLHVVTVALLLFFIGLTTAVATIRPVRLRVLDFIAKIEENYSAVGMDYNGNDETVVPEGWKGEYYPFYIPGEFILEGVDEFYNCVRYTADNGRTVEFSEFGNNDYSNFSIGDNNAFDVSINGNTCVASIDKESVSISWAIEDTYFSLFFSGDFDEAKRIVESVQRINLG